MKEGNQFMVYSKAFASEREYSASANLVRFIERALKNVLKKEGFSIAGNNITSNEFSGSFSIKSKKERTVVTVKGKVNEERVGIQKRNKLWLWLGIVGLFFFIIPGLICFLIYYSSGKTDLLGGGAYINIKRSIESAFNRLESKIENEKVRRDGGRVTMLDKISSALIR